MNIDIAKSRTVCVWGDLGKLNTNSGWRGEDIPLIEDTLLGYSTGRCALHQKPLKFSETRLSGSWLQIRETVLF
jgi:hypothetical protein